MHRQRAQNTTATAAATQSPLSVHEPSPFTSSIITTTTSSSPRQQQQQQQQQLHYDRDHLPVLISLILLLGLIQVLVVVVIEFSTGLAIGNNTYAFYAIWHSLYTFIVLMLAFLVYDTLLVAYRDDHMPRSIYTLIYTMITLIFAMLEIAQIVYLIWQAKAAVQYPTSLFATNATVFWIAIAASSILFVIQCSLGYASHRLRQIQQRIR